MLSIDAIGGQKAVRIKSCLIDNDVPAGLEFLGKRRYVWVGEAERILLRVAGKFNSALMG